MDLGNEAGVTTLHLIGEMMVRDFGRAQGWDIWLVQDLVHHIVGIREGSIQAFHMLKLGGSRLNWKEFKLKRKIKKSNKKEKMKKPNKKEKMKKPNKKKIGHNLGCKSRRTANPNKF